MCRGQHSAAEPQPTRFVGAGLALPSFYTTDKLQGQGKPSLNIENFPWERFVPLSGQRA
jgi:hypothetical protein